MFSKVSLGGSKNKKQTQGDHRDRTENGSDGASNSNVNNDYMDSQGTILSSEYARKRRELMRLHRDLSALGAQTVIPLPRIAVIGGQSAGKSSLVEAVSGINVPRDSGTCTRCPTECTMISDAESWSCQISLRFDHDTNGNPMPSKVYQFGPRITNKDEVEIWMRRAQAAILSPHIANREIFYKRSLDELRTLKDDKMLPFSKNSVCVDIDDPEATDLTFVDLPGLIQNDSPEVVDLVKNLVTSNIAHDNTLILVTIPMSDDMENQLAVRLAREADPTGDRTIGVLTKPDMLTRGATSARQRWKDILEGTSERHAQKHGFFCVRLADDEERKQNLSRAESDRKTYDFFTTTEPWNQVIAKLPGCFGIPVFVSYISRLLTDLIEACIPELKKGINRLLVENAAARARLPPKLSIDPLTEVLARIDRFCSDLQDLVRGSGGDKSLIHRHKASHAIFKKNILSTAPRLQLLDIVEYLSPEECGPECNKLDAILEVPREGSVSGGDEDPTDDEEVVTTDPKQYTLYDVRRIIKRETGWELPHYLPYDATKFIIDQSVKQWKLPALVCFDSAFKTLSTYVNKAMNTHFGQFPILTVHVQAAVAEILDNKQASAREAVLGILRLESGPFTTQNDHYFEKCRSGWIYLYRDMRARPWCYRRSKPDTEGPSVPYAYNPSPTSLQRRALDALESLGYKNLAVDDLHRLHPPDNFEEEITVMADVRAYFQVAYKRIIDYLPLTLEHNLNQALCRDLQQHLWGKLKLTEDNASKRLADWLAEDPIVTTKRKELETMHKRLLDMQAKLNRFIT